MAIGTKPACWRWKPPADMGAALLREKMRQRCLERDGEKRLEKYGHRLEGNAQWTLLWGWHKARCAICGQRQRHNSDLVTDHDHETELIRGLLCRSCNTLEGSGWTGAFDKYRERPPAVICGVRLLYVDPWGGSRLFARRSDPAAPVVVGPAEPSAI